MSKNRAIQIVGEMLNVPIPLSPLALRVLELNGFSYDTKAEYLKDKNFCFEDMIWAIRKIQEMSRKITEKNENYN